MTATQELNELVHRSWVGDQEVAQMRTNHAHQFRLHNGPPYYFNDERQDPYGFLDLEAAQWVDAQVLAHLKQNTDLLLRLFSESDQFQKLARDWYRSEAVAPQTEHYGYLVHPGTTQVPDVEDAAMDFADAATYRLSDGWLGSRNG